MRQITENSRALRRAYKDKMRSKARKLYKDNANPDLMADHLAACSCWMCGNPRKYFNQDTLAEVKHLDLFKSQIND